MNKQDKEYEEFANILMLDGIQLYLMKRNVSVPFQTEIAATGVHTGAASILECEEILRFLPERRMVCLAMFQGQKVLAKLFLHPNKAEQDYENEMSGYEHLNKSRILTPERLTSGALKNAGFYVLYEYIDKSKSLASYISCNPDNTSLAFIKQLLVIIAKIHNANIQQIDLHLNNFLVSGERNAKQLYTIDCGDISLLNKSAEKRLPQIYKNLSDILSQLPIVYDQFLSEFLKIYQQTSKIKRHLSKELVCHEINAWRKWRIRKYLKKAARNCSEFIREQNWYEVRVYKREYDNQQWQDFYNRLDELVETSPRLKDGNTATVALAQCGTQKVVIKRYNIKHFRHWLSRFWRPSRAWKSWHNAHHLAVLGIKTPRPIAVVEQRIGWLRSRAFYLSEYESSEDALAKYTQSDELSEQHVQDFKLLFTALVYGRISHGDLKANNILLTDNGLSFIDLDAMRFHSNSRRFNKALTRDLSRFLKNWPVKSNSYKKFSQIIKDLPENPVC